MSRSARSIKTLVSTIIDADVYDSNRIARLIDNLDVYQEKVDNLYTLIGDIPQALDDVSAVKAEVADLSAVVYGFEADLNEVEGNVSIAFVDISILQGNVADINQQLAALPTDVTSIVSDINGLKIDVSNLKLDVYEINANVLITQDQIADLSYTISLLPTDVGTIVSDIDNLEIVTQDLSSILHPVAQQTTINTNIIADLSKNLYLFDSNNVKLSGSQTISGNKTFTAITDFTNVTPATSSTSAAVIVRGGIGISANAYINGTMNVTGSTILAGETYIVGNIVQHGSESRIVQVGSSGLPNQLKNTGITALTVDTINGITNERLQIVNTTLFYDLVKQGNITPNLPTNITSTLQTLLNNLYSQGYRHFYLSKGTYIVQNITLGEGTVFFGDGKETIMKLVGSEFVPPVTQSAVFSLDKANITIRDLTVDGNRNNINPSTLYSQYEGIALDTGANYITIENVYVTNTYNDGLDMDTVSNCIVRNSWFNDCGGHGIHLNGEGTAAFNCINNIIDNCIIQGCGVMPILDSTFSGIHCNSQASHNSITNMTIIDCRYGGITNSGSNNNWSNIVIRNSLNTGIGIYIASTAICTNIDSVIIQGHSNGITCEGSRSVISSIQMDTIASTAITITATGNGNTLNNLSLNNITGSPLLVYASNTIIDDLYLNGINLEVEIYGSNNMFSNFALRNVTKVIRLATTRSSFSNFHWIDSDTITNTYVLELLENSSYNSFSNMNYSGNRSIHFRSSSQCQYNRFINGYIASGFTGNVLAVSNYTYILAVNTNTGVVNVTKGNLELGPNDNMKQTGTGIIDQSGSGLNILKSALVNGNVQVKTDDAGLRIVSVADVAGTNGRLFFKADASGNDYNTMVKARDSVIASTKGTINTGVLTLTTESNKGNVGLRITDANVYVSAPLNIELSGNVLVNGIPFIGTGSIGADVTQLKIDVADLSNTVTSQGQRITGITYNALTDETTIDNSFSITGPFRARNAYFTDICANVITVYKSLVCDTNVSITQSGNGIISQSGTGVNLLKAIEMRGQLDMSYNSIIDVSAIIGTNSNISIQPSNHMIIQGDRNIRVFPRQPLSASADTKSGVMLLTNEPYSAGVILEQPTGGNILSYGINVPQVGTRIDATAGGLLRFDVRGGANPLFQIVSYKAGQSGSSTSFSIKEDGNTNISATSASTSTATGALTVGGGVGIGGSLYVNGSSRILDSTQSTSTTTGAFVVTGGVGVGANAYVAGNVVISSGTTSTETNTGALQVSGGVGIGENAYIGGIGVVKSAAETTALNTGSFRVSGGASIAANAYVGGNIVVSSAINAVSTSTGALRVTGGVGIGANAFVGGNTVILSAVNAIATNTGALQVVGGMGVGANAYIGGNIIVQSTLAATTTSTGALQVSGGVGIAGSTYIGGQTFLKNTTASLTTSTGALLVDGGVGISGNISVGNIIRSVNIIQNKKLVLWDTTPSEDPLTATSFYGFGVNNLTFRYQTDSQDAIHRFYSGANAGVLSAGNIALTLNNESTNTQTGTLRVTGGAGIGGNVNIGGNTAVLSAINATATNTGALQVTGGAGVGGNLYVGGQTVLRNSSASLGTSTTGALIVDGGIGVAGNVFIDNLLRFKNITNNNKQLVLLDSSLNEAPSTATFFYGLGVNSKALRYQTDATDAVHRFYSGTADGILVAGNLSLNTNNSSTSTDTGTLRVAGGAGIGGNLYVGSTIYTTNSQVNKKIVLSDASLTEPVTNATLFYGFGINANTLRYQTDSTTGVHRFYSGTNNGTIIAGNLALLSENVSTDASSGAVTVAGGAGIGGALNVRGITTIENTTTATSTTTAAFLVKGGVGISGDIFVGGKTTLGQMDISGITTFRNTTQSTTTTTGAVVITGGLGVGANVNVGGNLTLSSAGNLVLSGDSTILQNASANGVNALKTSKMSGNLDLSLNSIRDVSSITTNGGTLTISSTNKVVFHGNNAVSVYTYVPPNAPNTTKNAIYINESAKSGIVGEVNTGNALIVGINTSHLGQRDTTLPGAIAKFDSRIGNPLFSIETVKNGDANTVQALTIDASYATTITGNTKVSIATESSATNTGAFQVVGGAGIGANLYVGGNMVLTNTTNASSTNTGALQVSGGASIQGNLYVKGPVSITDTTATTNTASGALRVNGGLSVGGNVYAENMVRIANSTINKKMVLQDLSINESVSTATQFSGFGIDSDSALRYQTASTSTFHKFYSGANAGILQAGNLSLTQNTNATSTSTGTLIVSGGAGVSGNMFVGGNLNILSAVESTSTNTGSVVFSGGVGIAANTFIGGNLRVVGNILQSGTGINLLKAIEMQGQLDMSYNSIIDVSAIIGTNSNISIQPSNHMIIQGDRNIRVFPRQPINAAADTKSGVMLLTNEPYSAGVILEQPTGGNILSYGINVPQVGTRIDATAGGLLRFDLRGGANPLFQIVSYKAGQSGSATSFSIKEDGNTNISTTSASTSTATGALTVGGGVGIGGSLYVNGSSRILDATQSTTTTTGAFVVTGGVGVGANVYVGGNANISARAIISSSTESTTTATGAVTVVGGVGVGANVYVGGNANISSRAIISSSTESTTTATGAITVVGGVGIGANVYVGGNANITNRLLVSSSTESTTTATGAVTVVGGVGIGANVYVGGNANISARAIISSSTESTTTATGAVTVAGGVGIGANVYVGGNLRLGSNVNSSTTDTGTLVVTGGIGVSQDMRLGGSLYQSGTSVINQTGSAINSMKAISITATTESSSTSSGALLVAGGAGIAGTVSALKAFIGEPARKETEVDISGDICVGRSVNTYPAFDSSYVKRTVNVIDTNAGMKIARYNAASAPVLELENWNATTLQHAWRVDAGQQLKFQYISGNAPGTAVDTLRIDSSNSLSVLPATESTSTATGSLIVNGGAGIGANLFVEGNMTITRNILQTGVLSQTGTGLNTMKQTRVTDTTDSTSSTTGAVIIDGGAGIAGSIHLGGNAFIGVGKQVVITTNTRDNSYNTIVDSNDSVVAGIDANTVNSGVLTLTTFSNQGDVGMRITNQNVIVKAPDAIDIASLMRLQKVSENFTPAAISGNTITLDYTTTNAAYYVSPSTSTNFSINISNVPNSKQYCSYTLTFVIDTSTYKIYGNSVTINSTPAVLKYGLGSAHANINEVSLAVQQLVIFYTTSATPNAVLTSVTGYI